MIFGGDSPTEALSFPDEVELSPEVLARPSKAPSVAPIQLGQAMPVEKLRDRTDRFRCGPYMATLSAGACVKRRGLAMADQNATDYALCRPCKDGERVAELTGGSVDMSEEAERIGRQRRIGRPIVEPKKVAPVTESTKPNERPRVESPPERKPETIDVAPSAEGEGDLREDSERRRRLPEPDRRKRAVSCCVTDEEQELIRAAAERADVSISRWTRDSLVASAQVTGGPEMAPNWRGKLTTTTTHSQSVELEVAQESKPKELTAAAPTDSVDIAKQIGQTAADVYRKLRDERAAIAIRSAELDEQIRHLAPLARLSDRTVSLPEDALPCRYSHKRDRHFGSMLLDDMYALNAAIHPEDGTDHEAEWEEYVELLNDFDSELMFYARIGLEHCATTRSGVTMASHLWIALELTMQLGPCGVEQISLALSEDDAEALRRLTELGRRGFVAQHRVGGFYITDAGKLALESPKPRKKAQ